MMIQKLRLQQGWSQEQLAELSGLSVRTIQRIERGQAPSVETLKSIAAVFDVDFSTLKEPQMETAIKSNPTNDEALAFARVRKLKSLYVHIAQYVFVVSILAIINVTTSPRFLWFLLVALGWGSGIVVHALLVLDKVPFLTGEWERAQVEKQLGRKL